MDMTALSHTFNMVSDRAAEMAVAALWQGMLVAGALAVFLRVVPRISAAYRFAAWTAAFVALVCLPLFSLIPDSIAGTTYAISAQSKVVANKPWLVFDARWSVAIAGLWLAASLFRAGGLALHSIRLRKLWKDAQPVQLDLRVRALLAGATADSACTPAEVCTTTTLQRPSVIGFFRPRILIPDWLFARLTQGELEQIVLHEAEHLRRRDDWTNLLQKLCLVLFPLNPALMWIERRMCREREMACDEGVVRVTRAPRAYAACLASIAERGLERRAEALSLGAWQRRPELVHRVHSILRCKGMLSPMSARVLLGTLGCGLFTGSIALGRSPLLVEFVPEQSAFAGNANHVNPAKTVPEMPVQIASVNPPVRNTQAVPSRRANFSQSPLAMDVTLRDPSDAGAIELKSSTSRETSDGAPTQILARAKRHDAKSAAQDEQLLVVTAWEQVETTNYGVGLRCDCDTNPTTATNEDAASGDQQASSPFTVTQLIYRVSPSKAGSNPAITPGANPSINQHGIAVFRDGWFVIQL